MVKPDKKNKREYERKKMQEDSARGQKQHDDKGRGHKRPEVTIKKPDSTNTPAAEKDISPPTQEKENPPSNFKGVLEDATKLITEANQRFLAAKEEEKPEVSWKRSITSNWTRYEIESEEEDEGQDELTGQEWDFAISSGSSAVSHIKLKGEQDWDTTGSTGLSTEFFSLDISELGSVVSKVPLYKQLGLQKEIEDFEERKSTATVEPPVKAILDVLSATSSQASSVRPAASAGANPSPPTITSSTDPATAVPQEQRTRRRPQQSAIKQQTNPSTTDVGTCILQPQAAHLEFTKPQPTPQLAPAAEQHIQSKELVDDPPPQEQRQRRRRNFNKNVDKPSEETPTAPPIKEPQVQDRKDKSMEQPSRPEVTNLTPPDREDRKTLPNLAKLSLATSTSEKDDLEFLESLDKEETAEPVKEETVIPKVVPVNIIKCEEKKDLEDWLDDFLAD